MTIKDRILEILEKTHLMNLATLDKTGVWVSSVVFIHDDDLNIFWISDPETRHSKAILENKQVAGTITFTTKSKEPNLGIQFSGVAHKIDGSRYDLALKHFKKRSKIEPKESEDVLEGDSWYMIKPNEIDLIDEENYGFEKKKLSL